MRSYESLDSGKFRPEKKRVFIFVEARRLRVARKKKKTVFVHRRVVCYDFRIYVARLLFLLLLLYYSLRRRLTEDEKLTVISLVRK